MNAQAGIYDANWSQLYVPAPVQHPSQREESCQVTPRKRPPRPAGLRDQNDLQMTWREIHAEKIAPALDEAYVMGNREAVMHFIEEHGLRSVLTQAREPLNLAFGERAVKTLVLVRDDEGFETLFCFLLVRGDVREARHALRRFDRDWWLARCDKADGRLNFDFQPL